MPIYEYRCEACGHELEVMQRISDPRLTTCPACEREDLKKLVSAAGFQLKGTGWYETDFKNKGKPSTKKDGKSGDDGAKGDGAKAKSDGGDTKPATNKSAEKSAD